MKRLLALMICGLMLTGCYEENSLRVGVGAPNSDFYKYTVKLNEKLEKAGSDIRLKPIFTTDSDASVRLLNNGIIDLALINSYALSTAITAVTKINPAYIAESINEKNYEVINDGDEIAIYNSTVAGVFEETLHAIVRADSPYQDISDLGEKTVVVGSYDHCSRAVSFGLLKDHGIKRAARKLVVKTPHEAVEMFKNQQAEALFLFDRIPSDLAKDVCNSMMVKFLPIEPERLKIITKYEKYLSPTTIFPKQYRGQNEPVGAININILLQAHNGVADSKIEKLMNAMFDISTDMDDSEAMETEKAELRYATEPSIKDLEFHSGAFNFYKKYGLNVKETQNSSPLFDVHIVAPQD